MKKLILAFFLSVLATSAMAKFIGEGTTNTANGIDSVDTSANAPWGVGPDARLHRLSTDNAGNLNFTPSGSGNLPPGSNTLGSVSLTAATLSGSLTSLGNLTFTSAYAAPNVEAQLSGTWVATLTFDYSDDAGATWQQGMNMYPICGQSGNVVTTATANGNWVLLGPHQWWRVRTTAFTSGTVTINFTSTYTPCYQGIATLPGFSTSLNAEHTNLQDWGGAATNAPVGNATTSGIATQAAGLPQVDVGAQQVFTGGDYGVQRSMTGTSGICWVGTEGGRATYFAHVTGLAVAASATDIATLTSAAGAVVRVTKVTVSGTQTVGSNARVNLVKRSTADSGGTSSTMVIGSFDSANPVAKATALAYTANPSLGTQVGFLETQVAAISVTAGTSQPLVWDFTTRNEQAPVLRGTAQQISVNLDGATLSGGTFNVDFHWTEDGTSGQ